MRHIFIIPILLIVLISMVNLNAQNDKTAVKKIDAVQLKKMFDSKDFVLINVHIPYAGEIPQTDLFIPFDQLEKFKDQLPEQKDSKIVVYCRSGSMSDMFTRQLAERGYSNVYDLVGGMKAWQKAGFELLNKNSKKEQKQMKDKDCCKKN